MTKIPNWQEAFSDQDVVAISGPSVLFRWPGQAEMEQGRDYQRTREEWCWWLPVILGVKGVFPGPDCTSGSLV